MNNDVNTNTNCMLSVDIQLTLSEIDICPCVFCYYFQDSCFQFNEFLIFHSIFMIFKFVQFSYLYFLIFISFIFIFSISNFSFRFYDILFF